MTDPTRLLRLDVEHVPWREIDGEIIALDPATSRYVSINGSGALLWHELLNGTTAPQLAAKLVETYDIDESGAGADVEAFVASLTATGWLAT